MLSLSPPPASSPSSSSSRLLAGSSIPFFLLLLTVCIPWCQGQQTDGCFTTINAVVVQEAFVVSDTSVRRTYSLCPSTRYEIGHLDFSNNLYDGQDMIPLRSNMHIRCGSSGNSQDACIVAGGDVQVDGTDLYGARRQESVENVLVEGLTFVNASKHNVWINKPGSITFKDCIFRDNEFALTPILADYSDNNAPSSSELSITFSNCLFENNRFAGPPAQPALVVANGMRNRLVFQDCNFIGNDMIENNDVYKTNSFLVETSGPLTMVRNCFSLNEVGVSNVATYGAGSLYYDNYQDLSGGLQCPFVSRYMTATQVDENTPFCMDFDASVCGAGVTPAPTTQSPTLAPTTLAPTMGPTTRFRPSASPTSSSPTFAPTAEPTTETTAIPTMSPTALPTLVPAQASSLAPVDLAAARSSASCRVFQTGPLYWMTAAALGLSSILFSCLT